MTIATDDIDTHRFEHGCAGIGAGASASVLPIEDCKDVLLHQVKKPSGGYAYETAGGHGACLVLFGVCVVRVWCLHVARLVAVSYLFAIVWWLFGACSMLVRCWCGVCLVFVLCVVGACVRAYRVFVFVIVLCLFGAWPVRV